MHHHYRDTWDLLRMPIWLGCTTTIAAEMAKRHLPGRARRSYEASPMSQEKRLGFGLHEEKEEGKNEE